ncbi:MAG: M48 family peptidase, partial [Porticoccaceae bacterium]
FIWYKLAEVRGLAGNISGVHIARAEYFILIGALENARRQLKFAEKLLKSDFKGLSIVQQRLLDIDKMEQSLSKL